jgi:hypothetical protein
MYSIGIYVFNLKPKKIQFPLGKDFLDWAKYEPNSICISKYFAKSFLLIYLVASTERTHNQCGRRCLQSQGDARARQVSSYLGLDNNLINDTGKYF